jgi:hypothetical protein
LFWIGARAGAPFASNAKLLTEQLAKPGEFLPCGTRKKSVVAASSRAIAQTRNSAHRI